MAVLPRAMARGAPSTQAHWDGMEDQVGPADSFCASGCSRRLPRGHLMKDSGPKRPHATKPARTTYIRSTTMNLIS